MAKLNDLGNITARCVGCSGAMSAFKYQPHAVVVAHDDQNWGKSRIHYRLYQCPACNHAALGSVLVQGIHDYPHGAMRLLYFAPEAQERLKLPSAVPEGIRTEFEEAERCIEANCLRAAAGMFRSVLDKTMGANGYKTASLHNLKKQIAAAAADGIITATRQRRAHDEVRVLGNDVLHDEWHAISPDDVEASHHYCQRVLEDFYDDRASVELQLAAAGRTLPAPATA